MQNVVVAIWWILFTVPMLVCVKEPLNSKLLLLSSVSQVTDEQMKQYVQVTAAEMAQYSKVKRLLLHIKNAVRASTLRLWQTCREVMGFKQLFLFLVAFWFYNDGISTVREKN